jgi:hypothetical protein
MQNEKGKNAMLTNVRSMMLSPRRVDSRLSITLLALNNWHYVSLITIEVLGTILAPFRSSVTSSGIRRRVAEINLSRS